MKNRILLTVAFALSIASNTFAFYDPSSGRWASRDPLNAFVGEEGRVDYLHTFLGFNDRMAEFLAARPVDLNDYAFVDNQPITGTDLFGFDSIFGLMTGCDSVSSGSGTYDSGSWFHHLPGSAPGHTLTFTICCPMCRSSLSMYSVVANPPPYSWPPITLGGTQVHPGRIFPNDWTTIPPITPSPSPNGGICYTIKINVPTRTAGQDQSGMNGVSIVGSCCSLPLGKSPVRSDPQPSPIWGPPNDPLGPTGPTMF